MKRDLVAPSARASRPGEKRDSDAAFKHRLIAFGMGMKIRGDAHGIEWKAGERFETWIHRITDAEVWASEQVN